METHAHHLHKAPGKNFGHFFFEFLMLFLAVFCGFLVENFREHKIEREREYIYLKNLLEDLKADTAIYASYIQTSNEFLGKIDSLELLMNTKERKMMMDKIYYVARTATMKQATCFPNQRTFDEMRQAGNLRLITNKQVADSISNYYNSLKLLENQNLLLLDRITDYFDGASTVFDSRIMFGILKGGNPPTADSCRLITEDAAVINKFLVKAQYFYGARRIQINNAIARTQTANHLITLINNKYHFE